MTGLPLEAPPATGAKPVRRPPVLPVGAVVWLASELMFFGALFAAWFTLRASREGPWPPHGVELETVTAGVFTALLVLSSITVQLAVRSVAAGRRAAFRRWLGLTMVLATAFVANQAREWASAGFSAASHAFGSAFFVLTGFHGLHVIAGIAAMGLLLGRTLDARFGPAQAPAVEVVSYYWHVVDVVWLAMFTTIFLVG